VVDRYISTHRGANQFVGALVGLLAVGELEGTSVVGDKDGCAVGAEVDCATQPSLSNGLQGQSRSEPPATSKASQIFVEGRD